MSFEHEDSELIRGCLRIPELAGLTALDIRISRPKGELLLVVGPLELPDTLVVHLAVPAAWITPEALARASKAVCRLASPRYDTVLLPIGPGIPKQWISPNQTARTFLCSLPVEVNFKSWPCG